MGLPVGSSLTCVAGKISLVHKSLSSMMWMSVPGAVAGSWLCLSHVLPVLSQPEYNPKKSKVKALESLGEQPVDKQSSVGHRVKDGVSSQLHDLLRASFPPGALFVPA